MTDDDAIALPNGGSVTRAQADQMIEDPARAADGSTGVHVPGTTTQAMVTYVVGHSGGSSYGVADDTLH